VIRRSLQPRPDWQERVEQLGFVFHSTAGPYWDESACYEFSADQIDVLEDAANQVQDLCLQAVEHIVRHDLCDRFQIPRDWVPYVKESWDQQDPSLYGRFDFGYDGSGPPKLLEYNADTPTALLEAAVVQWHWLQDTNPQADQFNSIHECLIDRWKQLHSAIDDILYFTSLADGGEDELTVQYLRDTAMQAGLETAYLPIHEIGWDYSRHLFLDARNRPLRHVFKLYPWEWLLREKFGPFLLVKTTLWYEPPWKMLLSNKAILPLLWELFPGHPHLLRAGSAPWGPSYVRKPCLGREGANIQIVVDGRETVHTAGAYEGPYIFQDVFQTPAFDGYYPVIGCWIVGEVACGAGIRESNDRVTRNTSRFVPHLFKSLSPQERK
jgi:glutathionylspermidine synthase